MPHMLAPIGGQLRNDNLGTVAGSIAIVKTSSEEPATLLLNVFAKLSYFHT